MLYFLGFVVSAKGAQLDEEKVKVIEEVTKLYPYLIKAKKTISRRWTSKWFFGDDKKLDL